MKRTSLMMKAILVVVSLFPFGWPREARAVTINLVSDSTWTVTDANGTPLGNAQNVCLNATTPSNCPAGATLYGYPFPGWIADLSSIPGATWIWAPNITGATSPAANAEFTFRKQFYLCGAPRDGTLSVTADDSAEVFLNGAPMSVLTSATHAVLSSATIPAADFFQGLNLLEVKVRNALDPPDCGSGQYRCNPAGLVLGASFADALNSWPTCPGGNGTTFVVGQSQTLPCPSGQTGTASRPCICLGSNGVWGDVVSTCAPTCTGTGGGLFRVGETEPLPCPPGRIGSASRTCQANGSWSPTDTSACVPPPTTCTGNNGITFGVGARETLPCPAGFTGSAFRTCQVTGGWGPTDSSACRPPQPTCTGNNGAIFGVGARETLPCLPGLVGSASRTCQASGSWGPTDSSGCQLPIVCPGCPCGSSQRGYFATCPSGTECKARLGPQPPRPWYCALFGIDCPVRLKTTDWYCDP